MRIEWLESFVLAATTKSLTQASELLNMTQPALSKQIKSLEQDLGARLFIRSTGGIELTEAGEILLRDIEPVLLKIRSIRHEILLTQGISSIRIGTWPSIATFYLPKKMADTQLQDVVHIKTFYELHDILKDLNNGAIDAALLDESEIQHSYWSHELFAERFYLFINYLHPLSQYQDKIDFEHIKDEPLVMLPDGCDSRALLEKAYKQHDTKLKISYECDLGQSILGFISANLGITILPEIFTQGINKSVIRILEIEDLHVERHISIIARNPDIGRMLLIAFK